MKDLMDLLQIFSLEQILIFIVMIGLAIKGVVDFYDWAHSKINSRHITQGQKEDKINTMEKNIDKLFELQVEQTKAIEKLANSVDILLQSDKDDIKAWITEQHHYFCYEVKSIDDFSLDCIERRYAHYQEEGGNSFVADLMADLRSLKKVPARISTENQNK